MLENLNQIEIILILIVFMLFLIGITCFIFFRKNKGDKFEEMDGYEFEYFCADLLMKRGFQNAEVTKASGDFGIDIIAERDGISYGIQCKKYNKPVGVRAIQEVYAGRDFYDLMVGVVMTNEFFTTPAVEAARKLKIVLWDGGYLKEMIDESDL